MTNDTVKSIRRKLDPFLEMIQPNKLYRTDGLNPDDVLTLKLKELSPGLYSQIESVSDLTESLYDALCENKNSIYYWFDYLHAAIKKYDGNFKTPNTSIWRMPIEVAQFTRIEYSETNETSRKRFNKLVFDKFELKMGKTYFIKTGTFSDKFTFANCKCSEPDEMGEYFQVINNMAMLLGAGRTVDLCVREYIEDAEGNPTIYKGMPLRTEFRCFYDFDKDEMIGVVPYWNPIVMKRALKGSMASMDDYAVYLKHEDKLNKDFNDNLSLVKKEIKSICKNFKSEFKDSWSIDVMKNGDDFYVIDMALMSESALTEMLPENIKNL